MNVGRQTRALMVACVLHILLLHMCTSLVRAETQAVLTDPPDAAAGVPYKEHYLSKRAFSQRPIAKQLEEQNKQRKRQLFDPLLDVVLAGNAPQNDQYIKIVQERLKVMNSPKNVQWLDTSIEEDRMLVGKMVEYCTALFQKKGADAGCVAQCHAPVDCGTQAARFCQSLKGDYPNYVKCLDRETKFCHANGGFNGEKYPNFKADAVSELERIDQVVIYCGDLFQMRGMKLPCLRTCSIFEMREKNPDAYYYWRAKHRLFLPYGADKSDPTLRGPGSAVASACENQAINLCRFIQQSFWRECYERVKTRCLRSNSGFNPILSDEQ